MFYHAWQTCGKIKHSCGINSMVIQTCGSIKVDTKQICGIISQLQGFLYLTLQRNGCWLT